MSSTLFYIHDPMCSWCWGFSKTLDILETTLPADVKLARVLGGLAADSDVPMPESMQQMLQQTWKQIQIAIPGAQFNYDFWTDNEPRRSTWLSCRAVIAAKEQDPKLEAPMIRAIQEAYYLHAKNPSNTDVLAAIAQQVGCNVDLFNKQLNSEKVKAALSDDMQFCRELGAQGFPSLRIKTSSAQLFEIPVSYNNPSVMLDQINQTNLA